MDIPSFLRMYPPFDELDDERLSDVVRHTSIEFYPAATIILQQGGEPAQHLYVVRTGAVELMENVQVLDLLTEGEVFGHPSLLSNMPPSFTVRAHEECLCYLIDREAAEMVLGTHSGLAFLSSSLRRRVMRALEGLDPESLDPWRTPVSAIVHRPPVTGSPTLSVRDAAQYMTEQRVSSLLIERAEGWGIITDRDMRSRVLAPGRTWDTTVGEVCSAPVVTVGADTIVAEVISLMLERGVHHVPVEDGSGQILGVVTDTDLMGLEQKTPFLLKSEIERAVNADDVVAAAQALPQTVVSLVEANVDPLDTAHVVAVAIDTMTRRFLEIGIRTLGDPPCPWAWLALGSEARLEQALLTDQDNALVLDPGPEIPVEAVDPYFERLTTFVNDQLATAGIPRCRAGVIASNREWRDSVLQWRFRFMQWMRDPGRIGSAFSGIAFDYRAVAGPLEAQPPLDEVIREARGEPQFIRHLARLAIDARPPSGFLKDTVLEARGTPTVALDVKHAGITPITNLARVYALTAGITERRTTLRLREAESAGRITEEMREGLEEALRLLWRARLEHQAGQVRDGTPRDDLIDPRALGPLARRGLKEAFRMIDRAQTALATELGLRR